MQIVLGLFKEDGLPSEVDYKEKWSEMVYKPDPSPGQCIDMYKANGFSPVVPGKKGSTISSSRFVSSVLKELINISIYIL